MTEFEKSVPQVPTENGTQGRLVQYTVVRGERQRGGRTSYVRQIVTERVPARRERLVK